MCGQREQGVSERERWRGGWRERDGDLREKKKGRKTRNESREGFCFGGVNSLELVPVAQKGEAPPDCKHQYVSLVFSILYVLSCLYVYACL